MSGTPLWTDSSVSQYGPQTLLRYFLTKHEVDSRGTSFNVTWQWERGNDSQPVHSFPYVRFNSAYLPGRLWDLSELRVNGVWDMFPSRDAGRSPEDAGVIANVALDMFLHEDDQHADSATRASHEVMVWFATYGGAAPFGNATGIRHQVSVQPEQTATLYAEILHLTRTCMTKNRNPVSCLTVPRAIGLSMS